METQNKNEEEIAESIAQCKEHYLNNRFVESLAGCYKMLANGCINSDVEKIIIDIASMFHGVSSVDKNDEIVVGTIEEQPINFVQKPPIESELSNEKTSNNDFMAFATEENAAIPGFLSSAFGVTEQSSGNYFVEDENSFKAQIQESVPVGEPYIENERLKEERAEVERLQQERIEQVRLEKERLEVERLEQERLEAERLEVERLEQERLEAERLEVERLEVERLEQERLEAERLEVERLEQERLEAERLEAERLEVERLEQELRFPKLKLDDKTDFSSIELGEVHKLSWGKAVNEEILSKQRSAESGENMYYSVSAVSQKGESPSKNENKIESKSENKAQKIVEDEHKEEALIDPWPAYPVEANFIDRSKSGSISKKFILDRLNAETFQPVDESISPFDAVEFDKNDEVFELWGDDHVSCEIEAKEIDNQLFKNVIDFEDDNSNSDDAPLKRITLDRLLKAMEEKHALGDFSGSLECVEEILKITPNHQEATKYLKENEQTLILMYESKIGSLKAIPRILTKDDEVMWMSLHHRAGFILSQIDGALDYEAIIDVSGMSKLEALKILVGLKNNGVIDVT